MAHIPSGCSIECDLHMSGRNKRFSVILCSRNRAGQVENCLRNLDVGAIKALGGEIVLVDSNSSDVTPRIMRKFMRQNPALQSVFVQVDEPGLSIARNAGVRASSGAILVYLDDDVYLAEDYFVRALERLEVRSPGVDFVGGRILLFDETDSRYGCKFGTKYWECRPGSIVRPGVFQGTNLCARRRVYDAVNGFDDAFGPGKKYRCDDVDFIARAVALGCRGAYDPNLVVFHHHGRKDGKDTVDLDRSNLAASGAFFASMVRQGHRKYFLSAVFYSLAVSAKRIVPRQPRLEWGGKAFILFWSGFFDYWLDTEASR